MDAVDSIVCEHARVALRLREAGDDAAIALEYTMQRLDGLLALHRDTTTYH